MKIVLAIAVIWVVFLIGYKTGIEDYKEMRDMLDESDDIGED